MNASTFPIVPPLESVALRLAHVDEQIERMIALSVEWGKSDPVTYEIHRSGKTDRVIVKNIRPIPPRISLLFSDAINQLRACLDNMVWHLATSSSGPPPDDIARRITCPIYEEEEKWIKWTKVRARDGIAELGPAGRAAARVRTLQPFSDRTSLIPERETPRLDALVGGSVERAHALLLLQSYSNHDKHRALTITVAQSYQSRLDIPLTQQELKFATLNEGSVILSFPAGAAIPMEGNTGFSIKRPDPLTGSPQVISELRRLFDYVRKIAIPSLATGLVLESFFPPGIDLGDSVQPVNKRIQEGSWCTADERFRDRLPDLTREALAQPPSTPKLVVHAPGDECAACSATLGTP